MPVSRIVVSDTSPLLNLALINELELLETQFASLTIPQAVWKELMAGDDEMNRLRELNQHGFLTLVEVTRNDLFIEIATELDLGETAAITYAIESEADLVLIDERDGRRVARRHGLTVTGVIGILLKAADAGDVELRDGLDRLRQAGFWISDELYAEALARNDGDNDAI